MIKVCNTNPQAMLRVTCGATPLVKGEIATFSSSTAIPGTEGISTQIILGVVAENTAAGAQTPIYLIDERDLEIDIYQGSTVKTFTTSDVGKLFDVYVDGHNFYIDPNDTTGAFCLLMKYDNVAQRAWVRIPNPFLYV